MIRIITLLLSIMTVLSGACAQDLSTYRTVFYDDFSTLSISNSTTYDGSTWYSGTKPCCMTANEAGNPPAILYPSYPPGADWGFTSPYSQISPAPGLRQTGIDLRLDHQSGNALSGCQSPAFCWVGAQIASAAIYSGGHYWLYGYFEVKMKLPATSPAEASWPSISFYALYGATNFEIDLIEGGWGTNGPYYSASLHDWGAPGGSYNAMTQLLRSGWPVMFDGRWHVYSMLWTPNNISMYQDGIQYASSPTPPEAQQPMYMAITQGIGGGWPTGSMPYPYHLQVAYVKVMQSDVFK